MLLFSSTKPRWRARWTPLCRRTWELREKQLKLSTSAVPVSRSKGLRDIRYRQQDIRPDLILGLYLDT